jgi:hypothetical protein
MLERQHPRRVRVRNNLGGPASEGTCSIQRSANLIILPWFETLVKLAFFWGPSVGKVLIVELMI